MKRLRLAILLGFSLVIAALAIGIPSAPAGGGGQVRQVHPGELQAAIAAARGGDTLVIHEGRYRGSFVIDKRLRLIGAAGEARPLIDGGCETRATILVRAPGVVLRRLHVVGADEAFGAVPSEVDFSAVASGRAVGLLVRDTCDAEYGINVFGSREVELIGNRGRGFSDAAFYVGAITSTGNGVLRVARNDGFASNRGLIVEDSAGGRIRVLRNRFHDNTAPGHGPPSGIFLHRSDGVLLIRNVVTDNGRFGIHLDPGSDRNRLFQNVIRRNPGGNLRDEGSGNCGSGNRPNPLPGCP
jgi:parallel beta-helix repeat protein